MLAKMGYKKGSGLGKDNIGAAEPIKLVLKEQRTGLGVDEDRKRRQEAVLEEQLERGILLLQFPICLPITPARLKESL